MSREAHVQFCERLGVRFPGATHRNIYVGSERAGQRVMESRGYAADSGRWCGSNGRADERGFANSKNEGSVRIWRRKLPGARTAPGDSRTRLL